MDPVQNNQNSTPAAVSMNGGNPIVKRLAIIIVLVLIVGIGVYAFLYFKNGKNNNYIINKNAQFQVTYDSLPIDIATKVEIIGSGTTPNPNCGNGTIYKNIQDALQEKDKKVCILALDNANLTSVPTDITKLKDLEFVFLRNNSLASFPKELLQLPKLKGIDISGNMLTNVPSSLNDLKDLRYLVLGGNKIAKDTQAAIRKNLQSYILINFSVPQ